VLGDREDRGDVVAGVGVVRGEEGVVVVQLAHGDPVGPGGPFRGGALFGAEHGGAVTAGGDGMAERLCAGGDDRVAGHRGDRDGGVVDDPVDDHLLDVGFDLDRVDGDLGHLPG